MNGSVGTMRFKGSQHSLFSAMLKICHDIQNQVVFPTFYPNHINHSKIQTYEKAIHLPDGIDSIRSNGTNNYHRYPS
jgi:hypothetical protein